MHSNKDPNYKSTGLNVMLNHTKISMASNLCGDPDFASIFD